VADVPPELRLDHHPPHRREQDRPAVGARDLGRADRAGRSRDVQAITIVTCAAGAASSEAASVGATAAPSP
jgi:hypothetical protein